MKGGDRGLIGKIEISAMGFVNDEDPIGANDISNALDIGAEAFVGGCCNVDSLD